MRKSLPFLCFLLAIHVNSIYGQTLKPKSVEANGTIHSIVQSGDTVFIGGAFTKVGFNTGGAAKFTSNTDAPDGNFPTINGPVGSIISDGNGGWYLAGRFSYPVANGQTHYNLAHVLPNGTFDPNFTHSLDGTIQKLVFSGSTLYVSGDFKVNGSANRQLLAAINASTGQAMAWDPQLNGSISDMVLSGSTLFISGYFTQVGGQTRRYLAALDTSTRQVTSWNPNPNWYVQSLALSGSTLYVGGMFSQISNQQRLFLAAVNTSTGQATSFNPQPNNYVRDLSLAGNTLYVAGEFLSIGNQSRRYLGAVDTSTGMVTSWNPNPNGFISNIETSGTNVYVGGQFNQIGGVNRQYFSAVNATTGQATNWNPEPDGEVIAIAANGSNVVLGGNFSFIKAKEYPYLAAYRASTSEILPWNPGGNGPVYTLGISGSTVYAGGPFTQLGGQTRTYIGAVNRTTGIATSWNPASNGIVHTLNIDGSTIYTGGSFSQIGAQNRLSLAALDRTTGIANNWNPVIEGVVLSLAVVNSTVYAGGSFSRASNQERFNLAAFNKVNGSLTAWNPSANSQVHALLLDGSLLYAGGAFTQIGGNNRSYLAALNTANGQSTAWNPQLNGLVRSITKVQDNLIAGGEFTQVGNQGVRFLSMINTSNGMAVGPYPLFNDHVLALHHNQASGTLYAGGRFTSVNDAYRSYLAAFDLNTSAIPISITTTPFGGTYTPGQWITVSFSTKGTFQSGNVFSLQISDATGSFASPTTLKTSSYSPISVAIPTDLMPGSKYRIRVVSTSPGVIGTDNGQDITIIGPSITTDPFAGTYRPGQWITASFKTTGTFRPGNTFLMQLSDANGSFASPTILMEDTYSPVSAPLPMNIAPGTKYRIRIVSASPMVIGTDNGTDLTITSAPMYAFASNPNGRLELQEKQLAPGLTLFPNPSSTKTVTIQLGAIPDATKQLNLEVYDMAGNKVVTKTYHRTSANFTDKLNLDQLKIGMYLLRIKSDKDTYSEKLILQ